MFPQRYLVLFVCNSVWIGQNLLNEVPAERCILSNFASYQPNSLNLRLNGFRNDNMPRSIYMD